MEDIPVAEKIASIASTGAVMKADERFIIVGLARLGGLLTLPCPLERHNNEIELQSLFEL